MTERGPEAELDRIERERRRELRRRRRYDLEVEAIVWGLALLFAVFAWTQSGRQLF